MINKIKPDIFQLYFKEFSSCIYLLKLEKNILIDTGSEEAENEFLEDLKQLAIKPEEIDIIILTHSHWDHIGNINLFKNATIYDHKNINKLKLKDFEIFKVPGHTKDSIALLYNNILFSGDALFHNGIGRTDFPESEPEKMQDSLNILKNLNYDVLCPGHI